MLSKFKVLVLQGNRRLQEPASFARGTTDILELASKIDLELQPFGTPPFLRTSYY